MKIGIDEFKEASIKEHIKRIKLKQVVPVDAIYIYLEFEKFKQGYFACISGKLLILDLFNLLRKEFTIPKTHAINIQRENLILSPNMIVGQCHHKYKSNDDVLYLKWSIIETFGQN